MVFNSRIPGIHLQKLLDSERIKQSIYVFSLDVKMTSSSDIDLFTYMNYRLFLRDYIQFHYLQKGRSYRAFSKRCDIGSPNYFQQIIAAKKNMSTAMAEKIALALGLRKNAFHYFVQLVRLENTKDANKRFALLNSLGLIITKQKKKTVRDEKFHSSWTYQAIWNLAHTRSFDPNPSAIRKAMRGSASLEEIKKSLDFLLQRNYLKFDSSRGRLVAQDIKIETDNDFRNLDLQRNHNRFLQIAQTRLNDDLDQREYQGLTMALTQSQIPKLKEHMRDFVHKMSEVLDEPGEGDFVVRLQLAAFIVVDALAAIP